MLEENMDKKKYIEPQRNVPYMTERRDLKELLLCADWVSTAHAIAEVARGGNNGLIRPGDYFMVPVKAEGGTFGGLRFEALDIPETELTVVHTTPDGKIIFNFEEALFYSAVNAKNTNEGGFSRSALCEYLNGPFLDALGPIRDALTRNSDGDLVTLPTVFEVFGDDHWGKDVNWEESPTRFEYFGKVKNRIRVKGDDTKWWWLSTAAYATTFALVYGHGHASYGHAGNTDGGVAPAICIF
jgi:hypothetical protein